MSKGPLLTLLPLSWINTSSAYSQTKTYWHSECEASGAPVWIPLLLQPVSNPALPQFTVNFCFVDLVTYQYVICFSPSLSKHLIVNNYTYYFQCKIAFIRASELANPRAVALGQHLMLNRENLPNWTNGRQEESHKGGNYRFPTSTERQR